MQQHIFQHLQKQLLHLYISPLSRCNLNCKMCYTHKDRQQLTQTEIQDFVKRYQDYLASRQLNLETITFCGGEVFLLDYFTALVNELAAQKIFIQIISNGTIDQLEKIKYPNWTNLIVSLDGLPDYHNANRGKRMSAKSVNFLKKAHNLGFHLEIFSVITAQNYQQINDFEAWLQNELSFLPNITYHPRKNLSYLKKHCLDNKLGQVENFDFLPLPKKIILAQKKQIFPPRNLGCYQMVLNSDSKIYPCCEAVKPIGKLNDKIVLLMQRFEKLLEDDFNNNCSKKCLGCSQSFFMCGLKENYVKC